MFELRHISKKIDNFCIDDISLNMDKGDYCAVVGISGAGKSILLELIAGLIKPDKGQILLNGEDITYKKIQKRSIGILFQDYALFPHMTARQNIEYSLKNKNLTKTERHELVQNIAKDLEILNLLDRKPITLSGGEQQRVSMARTLITKPEILLLDEPLSSLDVLLKNELIPFLRNMNSKGQTIIHVTHAYEEVISLANKVAIIENGRLLQQGNPTDVFRRPLSKFTANLSGVKNFFEVKIISNNNYEKCAVIDNKVKVIFLSESEATQGNIVINSDDIILSDKPIESSAVNNYEGIITEIIPSTLGVEICIDIGIFMYVTITTTVMNKMQLERGKKIYLCFKASNVKFYNK